MNLFKLSKKLRENGIQKFSFLISLVFTFFTILMIASCDFFNVNNDQSDSSPISVEIQRTSGAELNFIMTNEGSKDVYFSSYDVPFRSDDPAVPYIGHIKQYFKITDSNGLEVPYIGMYAMMEQTRDMWKLIKSGESINFSVNLFGEYDFPATSGNYKIEFISPVTVMDINAIEGRAVNEDGEFIPADDGQVDTVNSNEIESEIDIANAVDPELETRKATYPCNDSQKNWINQTKGKGATISAAAFQYASSHKSDSVWQALFGKANSSNFTFTSNGLKKIKDAMAHGWEYSCKPTSGGAIASTSKGSTYRVTLWPAFFKDTSTSSNKFKFSGSVLAHEASHWNEIIGTSDYAYYSNCAALAKTPSKAIKNADSYRQYIMNTSN